MLVAKRGGVANAGADGARTSRIAVKTSVCSTKRQAGAAVVIRQAGRQVRRRQVGQ